MEIIIIRSPTTPDYTEGIMELENGVRFCDTIEPPVHDELMKKTAIMPGRYPVILSYSQFFKRVTPEIKNVPCVHGVRIHPGSSVDDTTGDILVGKKDSPGHIRDSRDTYNILVYELTIDKSEHWVTII